MTPEQVTGPAIVQDAAGNAYQHMPTTEVPMYDWFTEREWTHTMPGGWWKLDMSRKVDTTEMRPPLTIVWEPKP